MANGAGRGAGRRLVRASCKENGCGEWTVRREVLESRQRQIHRLAKVSLPSNYACCPRFRHVERRGLKKREGGSGTLHYVHRVKSVEVDAKAGRCSCSLLLARRSVIVADDCESRGRDDEKKLAEERRVINVARVLP